MPPALLLGQTRLAIIDRSPAGHQPMRSADGRYTLIYNGEIYNYRELRQELEQAGYVFRTATDTEVLLQALVVWGAAALPRLTGKFAFAFLVDDTGCSKSVFRRAMRGIVPDAILDRRDKIGFATPERQWLESLGDWVDAALKQAEAVPYLRMDAARREWQAIRNGRSAFNWRVWRWLCYTRWVQLFDIAA